MFAPAIAQGVTMPAFQYGAGRIQDPVFTCPVSAIPDQVWQLVDLWLTCRAMKGLPYVGGVLDQPYVVRRAWPLLEAAIAPLEREQQAGEQMTAMSGMLGAVGLVRSRNV